MSKVLIVDDAYFVRLKLASLLEAQGIAVVEAENGFEAIKVYKQENPNLVFLDVTMPEMDGLETLKKLKEMAPDSKIVMLTGVGDQSVLMEALSSGASNFLAKPVDETKVLEVINSLLK